MKTQILTPASVFFQDPDFLAQGWEALFPGHQALNLEIGCGYAHFLAWLAPRFPEQAFVGLDIVSKVLRRAERRLQHHGVNNARLSKQDALLVLKELIPVASLSHLYILFPDPWPKDRHQGRRSLRADTLPLFASRLKAGGRLIFVTDDPPYAEQALSLLEADAHFTACEFPAIEVRTKYEKKWLEQSKTIHRLAYERRSLPSLPDQGTWQPCPEVPRLQLTPWQAEWLQQVPELPYPLVWQQGDWHLKLHRPAASTEGLVFPAVIAESGSLAQHSQLLLNAEGCLQLAPGAYLPYLQRREALLQALGQGLIQGCLA